MTRLRYSVSGLFAGVITIVLLLGTLNAYIRPQSHAVVALGGLSLATLIFSVLCGVCGQSTQRILLLSTAFYAWGWISLLLSNTYQLSDGSRTMLAILGASYAIWAWLIPDRTESPV